MLYIFTSAVIHSIIHKTLENSNNEAFTIWKLKEQDANIWGLPPTHLPYKTFQGKYLKVLGSQTHHLKALIWNFVERLSPPQPQFIPQMGAWLDWAKWPLPWESGRGGTSAVTCSIWTPFESNIPLVEQHKVRKKYIHGGKKQDKRHTIKFSHQRTNPVAHF